MGYLTMRLGLVVIAAAAALALAEIDDDGEEVHRLVNVTDVDTSGIVLRARSQCKIKQVQGYVKCKTKNVEDGRPCERFFSKPCPREELYVKPKLIEPAKAVPRAKPAPMPSLPRAVPKDQFGRYETVKLGMAELAENPSRPIGADENDAKQQRDFKDMKDAVNFQINSKPVPDIDVKSAADGHAVKVAMWKDAAEDMEKTLSDRAKAGAAFFLTKGEKKAHYNELLAKNRAHGESMWEKSESASLRHAPDYSMGAMVVPMKWPCKECDSKHFSEQDLINMEEWDEKREAHNLAEFRESLKAVVD